MKESRLNELMAKEDISLNEIMEVLGATLQSLSRHCKEIKLSLEEIENKINKLESEKDQKNLYGFIVDDEPDQDLCQIK